MLTLVTTPADPVEHRAAVARAEQEAEAGGRTDAVEVVRADARDWVVRLYNRSTWQPGWYEANWGRPGSASDRAALATALGDALTALVVWDRLDERERDDLAGPFGALID